MCIAGQNSRTQMYDRNNSPAARPEFVDISMIVTTGPENGLPEDGGGEHD